MTRPGHERQRRDPRPVVVGVDSSDRARVAALWATAEASLRGVDLHLVHSSPPTSTGSWEVPSPRGTAAPAAQWLLHDVARTCERAARTLTVHTHLEPAPAVTALVQWSAKAQLVVVGYRGASEFTGLMVGSVGTAVAERAQCPLVVVRSADNAVPAHSGPIVLGLTGSPDDGTMIDFGFAYAERARCPLIAVRNWWTELEDDFLAELFELGTEAEGPLARLRDEVSHAVARAQRNHPAVALTIRVVHARPTPTLFDEIERNRPQLVVLAAHDSETHQRFLGTTTRTLLTRADCPVGIVAAITPSVPQSVPTSERREDYLP
jgi:nucleotide-binding universal stress UspA family protein